MLFFVLLMLILLCLITVIVIHRYKWILPQKSTETFEQISYIRDSPFLPSIITRFEKRFRYVPSARQVLKILQDANRYTNDTKSTIDETKLEDYFIQESPSFVYNGSEANFLLFTREAEAYKYDLRNHKKKFNAFSAFTKFLASEIRFHELTSLIDRTKEALREFFDEFVSVCITFQDAFIKVDSLDVNVKDYVKDTCDIIRCQDEQVFLSVFPIGWSKVRNCKKDIKCDAKVSRYVLQPAPPTAHSDHDSVIKTTIELQPSIQIPDNNIELQTNKVSDKNIAHIKTIENEEINKILNALNTNSSKSVNVIMNKPVILLGNQSKNVDNFGGDFPNIQDFLPESNLQPNSCIDTDFNLSDIQRSRDMDLFGYMCGKGNAFNKESEFGKILPGQEWTVPQTRPPVCVTTSPCVVNPTLESKYSTASPIDPV
jgi:hypothetical protein